MMRKFSYRHIDAALAKQRERQATIRLLERDATEIVAHDAMSALALAFAASELRDSMLREAPL